jgi:hypothetical protein
MRGIDFVNRARSRTWTWSLVLSTGVALSAGFHLFAFRIRPSQCLEVVPDVPMTAGWLLLFGSLLAFAWAGDRERDWLSSTRASERDSGTP